MTGFMNAELERIRDNLRCGHCEAVFKGSDSQARKVKYEKQVVYCSPVCRTAAFKNKFQKPIPNRGPCMTCGKEFFSRSAKKYCSMECYLKSNQFAVMLADNREKALSDESRAKIAAGLKTGEFKPCLECGAEVYQKPSRPRKFCCTPCRRAYWAKRFDRWIANPEGLALPQCYDEFLDQQELSCLIEGCAWHGHGLTQHLNYAHGLQAREFKRAAGFNIQSGIISKTLAEILSARAKVGVAVNPVSLPHDGLPNDRIRYRSKEAAEHARKARALASQGPQRQCAGCGGPFIQSTIFGRALYCSPECRDNTYAERKRARAKKRVRRADGTFEWTSTGADNG